MYINRHAKVAVPTRTNESSSSSATKEGACRKTSARDAARGMKRLFQGLDAGSIVDVKRRPGHNEGRD